MGQRKQAAYDLKKGSFDLKVGLAEMLRGGVIIDVTTPEQARIAEDAGAVAVMALERISADIISQGGISRMSHPELIKKIQEAVSIPVMAKCRIGHFVEAQILEALFVDFIDESEVLTAADQEHHINKHAFRIPFVCGCSDLGEALRRIGEGASLLRTKGEAGTGNVVSAVKHMRSIQRDVRRFANMDNTELMTEAKKLGAPYRLVQQVAENGKLPVPIFAAGGIATPADAAMLMQLGAESVFVGSGIFKHEDASSRAKAIVGAVSYHKDPEMLAKISRGLLSAMPGVDIRMLDREELLTRSGG
ncbi:MAG: pyridoxal 5'-phosphate synthase lyase subunit PdxS [Chlamydiota bacterium]|nr:pyridoxal 5'-phosphate synthase lyase subunit PdxS [Chlamydiota bacterium]